MEDVMVVIGGMVKSLGDGKFSAPLVTFSDQHSPDLAKDFFTKDTNFWVRFPSEIPLLYQHGQDTKMKTTRLGGGSVKVSQDELHVWMEGQLNLANEYEAYIHSLIEQGKMGASSGSASHLVERKSVGDAFHVTSWPIVEGSLTPNPCEPRNKVMSLKSFLVETEAATKADIVLPATTREFEEMLREKGFSRQMSEAIASKGFRAIESQGEPDARLIAEMQRYTEREARYAGVA
jgi:hypothetical protein